MFGNAGAKPPTDAGDPPDGSVSTAADGQAPISEAVPGAVPEAVPAVPPGPESAAESSIASANNESVGHWLEQLPERSWDESPGE